MKNAHQGIALSVWDWFGRNDWACWLGLFACIVVNGMIGGPA